MRKSTQARKRELAVLAWFTHFGYLTHSLLPYRDQTWCIYVLAISNICLPMFLQYPTVVSWETTKKTRSRRFSVIYAFRQFDKEFTTVSRPKMFYTCIGDFNHIFAKVSSKYDSSFLKKYQKTSSRRYSLISAFPLLDTDLITVSRPNSVYICIGDSLHISDKVSSNSDSYFSRIAKKPDLIP